MQSLGDLRNLLLNEDFFEEVGIQQSLCFWDVMEPQWVGLENCLLNTTQKQIILNFTTEELTEDNNQTLVNMVKDKETYSDDLLLSFFMNGEPEKLKFEHWNTEVSDRTYSLSLVDAD